MTDGELGIRYGYDRTGSTFQVPVRLTDTLHSTASPVRNGNTTVSAALAATAREKLAQAFGWTLEYLLVPDAENLWWDNLYKALRVPVLVIPAEAQWARVLNRLAKGPAHNVTLDRLKLCILATPDDQPAGSGDWAAARLEVGDEARPVGWAAWAASGFDAANPQPAGLYVYSQTWAVTGAILENDPADIAFCVEKIKALFVEAGAPLPTLFVGEYPVEEVEEA